MALRVGTWERIDQALHFEQASLAEETHELCP
jgi:hypothetical protein